MNPPIINEDCDFYIPNTNKLLFSFRKNIISEKNSKQFYDNINKFARNKTSNRGSTTNSQNKNVWDNEKVMSNIIGYYDKYSPQHKYKFKNKNVELPKPIIYETRFSRDFPDKFEKLLPFINETWKSLNIHYHHLFYDDLKNKKFIFNWRNPIHYHNYQY